MNTLSVYLGKVLAQATAAAAVNFDTVTTLTIEEGAEQGSESSGLQYNGAAKTFEADGGGTAAPKTNWDGLVYANTKSTYESTNPTARTADAQKRAWVFDVSDLDAATNTVTLKIGSSSVTQLDNGTYGAISVDNTSNLSFLIGRLKNGASVTRAANLGATYEVYKGANAVMPTLTIRDSSTKADNGNGEGFTNAQIAARNGGDGTLNTSYNLR